MVEPSTATTYHEHGRSAGRCNGSTSNLRSDRTEEIKGEANGQFAVGCIFVGRVAMHLDPRPLGEGQQIWANGVEVSDHVMYDQAGGNGGIQARVGRDHYRTSGHLGPGQIDRERVSPDHDHEVAGTSHPWIMPCEHRQLPPRPTL